MYIFVKEVSGVPRSDRATPKLQPLTRSVHLEGSLIPANKDESLELS